MNWQWLHRFGSPKWFYEKTHLWVRGLGVLACGLLLVGAFWGRALAPADARQGNSYRIIYIHVPSAVVSMAGYYVMAIAGAIGLIWRTKLSFIVMRCAAPIGAFLTFAALFTGAVWGKPTWGTYWVWDARITSMLILLFLYLGIIALQGAFQNQEAGDRSAAWLAIVGMVNVPIIYKSVEWWNTLHQAATIKFMQKSTIDSSMLYPLIIMFFAFYVFYFWSLLRATRAEILRREIKTQWVNDILKG
jgi:heme exporter protein C